MTTETSSPDRHLLGRWAPWIAVLVLAGVGAGVFTAWRASGRDREPADLDPAFVYDVEQYRAIPPDQIGYREVARIATGLAKVTSIAVGPAGEIVVGGGGRIAFFSPDGTRRRLMGSESEPLAMTVSAEGELFVGCEDRTVFSGKLDGNFGTRFTVPGEKARITSIAVSEDSVFVADAGSRGVWHFSRGGTVIGRIGDRDRERRIPGFSVPSPYFDLLLAPDGLLRIVDPGRRRVTAFTVDGNLELAWGKASLALDGFGGCCNPSHIAMLPDGRFVTSEKGIPRVKVHDADGTFVTAVVGCEGLDTETGPCDVAADREGRILVLDPGSATVRVFEPKKGGGEGGD